jgi:translation initiation factor 4G
MLGNIQFIGHLFRQRMLTENIMHQCVKKLLENDSSPRVEDLECLSKLLTTIGGQLETPEFNTRKMEERMYRQMLTKARQTMDVYMGRISRMSEMETLDSRIRFMLKVRDCCCAGPLRCVLADREAAVLYN